MLKTLFRTVLFTLALVTTQTALADAFGCGEGMKSMLATMKLEQAQIDKIKPVLVHFNSDVKDTANMMKPLDIQISQQGLSDKMDPKVLSDLVDKKAKLIGNMMKSKIIAQNQILAILTPEQRQQMQVMIKRLEDKIASKFKSCHLDD